MQTHAEIIAEFIAEIIAEIIAETIAKKIAPMKLPSESNTCVGASETGTYHDTQGFH